MHLDPRSRRLLIAAAVRVPGRSRARCSSLALLVVSIVVVLVAGACSRGSGGRAGDVPARGASFDPIPGMEVREDLVPISPEDETLVLKAEWRLANACMAKRGFPATKGPEHFATPDPPDYLSPAELLRGGYQFDFATEAAGARAVDRGTEDPTAGLSAEQAEQFARALGGDPDGPTVELATPSGRREVAATGCLAKARARLFGTLENYLRYDEALQGSGPSALRRELERDHRYGRAVARWQRCMTAAGSGFPTAFDAGVDYGAPALRAEQAVRRDEGAAPLSDAEITATAHADADCQQSSGLFERRQALLPAARDAVLARFGLESSELVAFQRAVLERAKAVR